MCLPLKPVLIATPQSRLGAEASAAPGPQPHSAHPGGPGSSVPGWVQQLLPSPASPAGGHRAGGDEEHCPVPHTFHNLTDGAMEQEG